MSTAKKIEELRAKIDELEAQLKAESEPMFGVPNVGDDYYVVDNRFELSEFIFEGDNIDDSFVEINNAFTDEKQAQACADYLKDRFWYIRKAIEFADGYEFVKYKRNFFASFDTKQNKWKYICNTFEDRGSIYMTELNAVKFCEWLNKHKPEGF